MKRQRSTAIVLVLIAGSLLAWSCTKPATPIQLKMREVDKIWKFSLDAFGRRDFPALKGQAPQMAALVRSDEVRKAAPYASNPSWQESIDGFARECANLETNVSENVMSEILISWDGVKTTCQNCHRSFKPRK